MSFTISSLVSLPIRPNYNFYIYAVGLNWTGGLGETILNNFERIGEAIGPKAAITKGYKDQDWTREVAEVYFSHNPQIVYRNLPALVISDANPNELEPLSLRLFVPLSQVQEKFGNLDSFFSHLVNFVRYDDLEFFNRFQVQDDSLSKMLDGANEVIELKPSFFGISINVNAFINRLRRKN